ncbi:MAG: signal transduction histidine kinase, partial [Candidatus Latescibacterota bacterium]
TINRKYVSKIAQIFGDPTQIEQVIRNLIVNAAQAMESSVEKVLTIGVRELDREVCVTIQDTGHGIPQAKLADIFQPFYTTKPEGKGTGLGLAIVHAMLKRHDGAVEVDSEEGVGTIFQLRFPLYQEEAVTSATIHLQV